MDATAPVEAPGPRSEDVDLLNELVRPAIEAMPPSRRRMVVQLQSQGLDDAKISETLGIAPDRVHRHRSAAISQLRSALSAFIRDRHRKKTSAKKDR
ncbi:hypothetical protein [Streptomyces sp. CL12-4]|uniref:hypothetical protein n=1 Tax=Streptomyces sp. CL12-4 TaxID=2810306 RepID=UPI001EFB6829|nr:hypothetical protein [Streptomyces sp. CL12-4]MCG8970226.1 hypothetical protein [Streptomyces sp. CL12-4]